MTNEALKEFYNYVKTTELPKRSDLFAGSNLIITNNTNRAKKDNDVVIYTQDAETLSWFVFNLKEIFKNDLDCFNKYSFYPQIGLLLNEAINNGLDVREQMLFTIERLQNINKSGV